jgi:hypothetical protein
MGILVACLGCARGLEGGCSFADGLPPCLDYDRDMNRYYLSYKHSPKEVSMDSYREFIKKTNINLLDSLVGQTVRIEYNPLFVNIGILHKSGNMYFIDFFNSRLLFSTNQVTDINKFLNRIKINPR